MTAYYNEIDRFACDWLSNLMDAGLITPGKIDDRSIHDVRPEDLDGFERVHFFAGIGGWDHALNLAGWRGPVWTGSCPCQPFSLAGAQKGFDDARHLWPELKRLIAERRPAKVFGEQVASATEWLRLVRSELEAMGYAVGAMPVQAASAGAEHLRDRYWFVASDLGNASGAGLAFGSIAEVERGNIRGEGASSSPSSDRSHALADADVTRTSEERSERSRELSGAGGDPQACDGRRDMAYATSERGRGWSADSEGPSRRHGAQVDGDFSVADASGGRRGGSSQGQGEQPWRTEAERPGDLDWVLGADGKARCVKPGIRLLAHGIPNRVGLLRGFGNAIDPRPAAQFIIAAGEAMTSSIPSNSRGGVE